MDIGKKIKQLRQHKGITQEVLAEVLSVSYQAVSKWENGSSSPDIGLLPALSAYFGTTIDDLFTLSEDAHLERIENMLERQQNLSEEDQQYAIRQLTDMIGSGQSLGKAHGLLAQTYNHMAKSNHLKAAHHSKLALRYEPTVKDHHVALVEASEGVFVDWNYVNHKGLIDYYKSFVKENPGYRGAYLWLLDHLIADGRLEEASETLEGLKSVDSGYICLVYAGKIEKAAGHFPQAMDCWNEAVARHSENWLSYACRADENAKLGHYEAALKDYETAMTIQPKPRYYDGYESQAMIYELVGEPEKAIVKRQAIIKLLKEEWQLTFGEMVEKHLREIERLKNL